MKRDDAQKQWRNTEGTVRGTLKDTKNGLGITLEVPPKNRERECGPLKTNGQDLTCSKMTE